MPTSGTMGTSFSAWQSQLGETSTTRDTWKQGRGQADAAVLNTEDNLTNFGLVAAGGVVSVIPITLFVIFAQNYLISGLSSGAVKE